MSEDPRGELATLVAQLRAQVAWHARAGTWGGSAAPTPRPAGAPADVDVAAAAVDAATAPGDDTVAVAARTGDDGHRLTLPQIRDDLGDCTRCKLSRTRNKIVFGVGDPAAPLMFVGEAPGADEDRLGDPFVGRAGQLLDKMIEAMGWSRDTVYIANSLKCRPPGNRNPEPDELAACTPFLWAQVRSIRPRVLVALGRPAANTILGNQAPISALRGRFHEGREGVRVMPTFHPAFLLRQPERKRDAWNDLKMVIAELERLGVPSPNPPRT